MCDLFRQTVRQGCQYLGIQITNEVVEKFEIYYQLLCKKNNEFNLTAITTPEEAAEKHFIDSLTLYYEIDLLSAKGVIDIGSGAGFPGLPLKIYKDELDMTLVDAVGKKIKFVQQVIQIFNLHNVNALQARIEDFATTNRGKYGAVISRAVAELRVLVEYALPLIEVGGFFIAAKGPKIQEEVELAGQAIDILGGEIMNIRQLSLPISKEGRSIITIKKIKSTPSKYPRRVGIPTKRPL